MNIERLTTIAEWLEAGAPERDGVTSFDMRQYRRYSDCGTTCCIAGTASEWWGDQDASAFDEGMAALGLNYQVAYELFDPSSGIHSRITPAWAARCIRKLIATGAVDWEGTREVAP